MKYGAFVLAKRLELGMSQQTVADRAGLIRPYLSQVENGKIGLPGPENRQKLHAALGTSEDDLRAAGILPEEPGRAPTPIREVVNIGGDRALLMSKIPDLPDEAISALLANAVWWESRVQAHQEH